MDPFEKKVIEKAVLCGLSAGIFTREENATEETLDELEALLETAGGQCVAKVLQSRPAPDPHSFIGEGKVEEVKELLQNTEATLVVFDNDLSPSQQRALEQMTGVMVMDRSGLILDIFAQRAKTREGRLQVELAQYKYLLPRLTGMWTHLERQEGSIGSRGPGETQLETDRRLIRKRITKLEDELQEVRKNRATQRQRRLKNSIPVVAIVGYTNAGKSTLLNHLTDAGIPANNRLFDTLDTTTRQLTVSDTLDVLLSDTVGFIAKLPHHLVEAFKATLEELEYADLLLHVIDASDPEMDIHVQVVDKLIAQLAKPGIPVIECYNKADLVEEDDIPRGENRIGISARTGDNMAQLLELIEKNLNKGLKTGTFLLPYAMGGMVDTLHKDAKVLRTEYTADGIEVEAICDEVLYGRLSQYLI
ncbi:MAG: GTPase HflX [Oscillospiraceae bacterium]|nr:GTPase HflX [Oscillospiraceae bacterium]